MRQALGVVVLFAAGLGLAQDDKKGGAKAGKIEGTYLIVGFEGGGQKAPAEFFEKAPEAERTVKITTDKLISSGKKKEDSVAYTIDPSKSPAHITTTETEGGKSVTSYGIYKLEGDTLTICMIESQKAEDRPKEFKTVKGGKAIMMTLKKK
jgi:uncharacterized protein (TIGR03067 family)